MKGYGAWGEKQMGAKKRNSTGKVYGRTFGLQSLRKGGLGDRCHCVAGSPEVLLSLLPRTADYTFSDIFLIKASSRPASGARRSFIAR